MKLINAAAFKRINTVFPIKLPRQQQLQATNMRAERAKQHIQQLQQQVNDIIQKYWAAIFYSCVLPSQLAAMNSEVQPHWIVRREEVVMTNEVLGMGV